jgi:hypothetical protein
MIITSENIDSEIISARVHAVIIFLGKRKQKKRKRLFTHICTPISDMLLKMQWLWLTVPASGMLAKEI